MYKFLVAFGLAAISPSLFASSSSVNLGPNLTTGPSTNHHSLFSGAYNPAASAFAVEEDERWRFNFLPAIAASTEVGEVDNFADELDELIDILDDPANTDDSVEEVLDRFNTVLEQMGETGYIKTSVALRAPILPLYYRSDALDGTFYVDYQLNGQVGARVLDDELQFDNQNMSFATSSSLYLKSGVENRFSFGFATYHDDVPLPGNLYWGARVNVMSLELSKQVLPLQVLDGESIEDVIEDEYDNNLVSTTAASIDVGAVLAGERWRAGLTLANIGEPSFDYGVVGENCEARADGSQERTSCEVAKYFAETRGEIATRETHTMKMRTTVDAALMLVNGVWLSGSMDLAEYNDIVGFENQWANTGLSFDFEKFWLPSLRFGYQTNLAEQGTSSAMLGLTLFRWLNLDVEQGTESVVVDGDEVPRRVGVSISLFERF